MSEYEPAPRGAGSLSWAVHEVERKRLSPRDTVRGPAPCGPPGVLSGPFPPLPVGPGSRGCGLPGDGDRRNPAVPGARVADFKLRITYIMLTYSSRTRFRSRRPPSGMNMSLAGESSYAPAAVRALGSTVWKPLTRGRAWSALPVAARLSSRCPHGGRTSKGLIGGQCPSPRAAHPKTERYGRTTHQANPAKRGDLQRSHRRVVGGDRVWEQPGRGSGGQGMNSEPGIGPPWPVASGVRGRACDGSNPRTQAGSRTCCSKGRA